MDKKFNHIVAMLGMNLADLGVLMSESSKYVPPEHREQWVKAYNHLVDADQSVMEIAEILVGSKAPPPPPHISLDYWSPQARETQ